MVQMNHHIDKMVCFVDKDYRRVSCSKTDNVNCSKTDNVKCDECNFCQKYRGKEERYFFYTRWDGTTDKSNLKDRKRVLQ